MESNLIKRVCKELGLTQKELAERLGVKPSAVSNWSNGDIPNLAKIVLEQMIEINKLQTKLQTIKEFKKLLNDL
ncbi:helix-turn-helix domain-containing protein [Hydrogenimonas thermophila]|uniref:Helix-turn-helix n=1 Tax=Hydrogenimonas thermophila TaxID=223786 RepID=A0A1I5RRN5_9BACT|nr:helix-turn-helix transcriptional regulator [Hydrogenimonas thermophila]SFP61153.1 Helix-turn-helix [Hydrogenimonas thermophila]